MYHCLADIEGGKWERCVEKSLIKEGYCPIFTYKGFIDWKECNISIPTCPNVSYVSNEVYKYSHCFGNNSFHKQTGHNENDATAIGIVCGLLAFAAAVLTFGFLYMRRRHKIRKPNEIVKEQNVHHGIALLSRQKIRSIVVVGKFGNSVASTSRRILKKFQKRRNWKSHECRYTDIPDIIEENTIMFVYGWFGTWNDDLCSVDRVRKACQSLIRILNETNNVKMIIGMRSDLNKKYHQELNEVDNQDRSLFHYEINLDSGGDVGKDKEYSRYFEKNVKKPCKQKDCACKSLNYETLREGEDTVVGMPLKISVIKEYHELIPQYLDNWDILRVMIDHFTALENDREKRYAYEWILYICLKGKFRRSDEFDTDLVKEMKFEIEQSLFNENDEELCRYIRMRNSDKLRNVPPENAQYVFWHPFIYICAFHFLFHKDPESVMKHCNLDAILQLVRPNGFKTSYFEVAADARCVMLFNKRIRSLGIKQEYAYHPLYQFNPEMITEIMTGAIGIGMEMFGMLNVMEKDFHDNRRATIIDLDE